MFYTNREPHVVFSINATLLSVLIGLYPYLRYHHSPRYGLFAIAALLQLLLAAKPSLLRYGHQYLTIGVQTLLVAISTVMLFIMYFLIVTPVAICKRITGYDPLQLRATDADSFWQTRVSEQFDQAFFNRQF